MGKRNMSFGIKINALLTAMLLVGITFMFAVNGASAHTPNDTYWSNQWGPGNIYAPQAWDIQKGSTNITIAILDTGIDYNHEDLAGRVIQGWNFANNSSEVMDDNSVSHGTHVSGIAAAIMDNSKGITGIAQSKLLVVKTCNFMGICTWASIKNSIYYAAYNGAKIISMSIQKNTNDSAAKRAADYAYNTKGALLIACAGEAYIGNGTEFIAYPGNFSEVIAVGATDSNNQLAYFSNYGAKLELVAPGVDIYSTVRNNGYDYESGCSMSVPHVSGVAALVWSQYPALSNNEVRQILTGTADDLGSSGRDIYYGYGRVNAYKAVSYLPGWGHRKQKTINGSTAGVQTNYTMKLTIYNSSGTDTPGVVYLNGNARSDFGDLRFTKSDGVTLLDYWIESYTSGVSATVWVEVDSIPASPNTASIYIYYGNPSATSASSVDNTLEFFDDFTGNLGKWTYSGTSIVSGHAEIAASGTDWGNYMYSVRSFDRNDSGYLLEIWVAVNGRTYNYHEVMVGFGSTSSGPARPREAWYHWGNTNDNSMYTMDAGNASISCCGLPTIGEFRRYSIYIYKTSGGLLTADFHSGQPTLTEPDTNMRIKIQPYKGGAKVSYVMARKYANPEPAWG